MDPWMAAVSALGGGVLVVLVGRVWPSRDTVVTTEHEAQAKFRDTLMNDVCALRKRISKVETEVSEWREKYYGILAAHVTLQNEHQAIRIRYEALEIEIEELRGLCQRAGLVQ